MPVYPSRWAERDNLPDESERFYGNTGPLAGWVWYHSGDVRAQLESLKSVGFNTIRPWLHYEAWNGYRDDFIENIRDLAQHCDDLNIYTNWVIFDDIGIDPLNNLNPTPQTADPSAMTIGYTSSPSVSALSSTAAVDAFFAAGGDDYLTDVVSALSGYQSTLVWDIMNEPRVNKQIVAAGGLSVAMSGVETWYFVEQTLEKVKALDPHQTRKTTVGYALLTPYSAVDVKWNPTVSSSNLDIISMHEYSLLSSVRTRTYNGRASLGEIFSKSVWMTECINPNNFIIHNEVFDWYCNTQLGFDGEERAGLGVIAFCPTIGHPFCVEAFKLFGTGLFHSNGRLKDKNEVSALISIAREQTNTSHAQFGDHISQPEIQASSFVRDLGLIEALSSTASPVGWDTYQTLGAPFFTSYDARFYLRDTGYTSFAANPGDTSSVFPIGTPFSQQYGVPDNTKLGKYNVGIKKLGRNDIVSAVYNWDNRIALSSYELPAQYDELQREYKYQAKVLSMMIFDLSIASDTEQGLVGTVHERNLLASSIPLAGNARLMEVAISAVSSSYEFNNMLSVVNEIPTEASAATYDVSYGIGMDVLVSAIGILGEVYNT